MHSSYPLLSIPQSWNTSLITNLWSVLSLCSLLMALLNKLISHGKYWFFPGHHILLLELHWFFKFLFVLQWQLLRHLKKKLLFLFCLLEVLCIVFCLVSYGSGRVDFLPDCRLMQGWDEVLITSASLSLSLEPGR